MDIVWCSKHDDLKMVMPVRFKIYECKLLALCTTLLPFMMRCANTFLSCTYKYIYIYIYIFIYISHDDVLCNYSFHSPTPSFHDVLRNYSFHDVLRIRQECYHSFHDVLCNYSLHGCKSQHWQVVSFMYATYMISLVALERTHAV